MAKTNYNKMSDKPKSKVEASLEIETGSFEVEQITKDVETTKPVVNVKKGVVTGCTKLNVRKAPDATAEIIGTIDAGETVVIHDEIGSFYKVGNPDGDEYCMKKYISVK